MMMMTCVRASSPPTSLEQAPHIGRKRGSKDFTVPDDYGDDLKVVMMMRKASHICIRQQRFDRS